MTLCPGLPRWVSSSRINHSGFCWSRHDEVAVASAEPYASYLHFAPEDNHANTSSVRFLRADTQPTTSKHWRHFERYCNKTAYRLFWLEMDWNIHFYCSENPFLVVYWNIFLCHWLSGRKRVICEKVRKRIKTGESVETSDEQCGYERARDLWPSSTTDWSSGFLLLM